MSLEVFDKLEVKIQQVIDTITLLQMEIEELKEKNNALLQELIDTKNICKELEHENNSLHEQESNWTDRVNSILGRIQEI